MQVMRHLSLAMGIVQEEADLRWSSDSMPPEVREQLGMLAYEHSRLEKSNLPQWEELDEVSREANRRAAVALYSLGFSAGQAKKSEKVDE